MIVVGSPTITSLSYDWLVSKAVIKNHETSNQSSRLYFPSMMCKLGANEASSQQQDPVHVDVWARRCFGLGEFHPLFFILPTSAICALIIINTP
jgi:hypothetical protein